MESKFSLGQIVGTPACIEFLMQKNITPLSLLERHASGDWGDICKEDAETNDLALLDGNRILSAYKITENSKVWIITEADRSSTCLLLPSEY